MKKLLLTLTVLTVLFSCTFALAEVPERPLFTGSLENGCYILKIALDPADSGEWNAERIDADHPVVELSGTERTDDTLTVRYLPVQDGTATVCLRHFSGTVCDQMHGIDLLVKDGQIAEATGGYYTASPSDEDLDAVLAGDWLEEETQFSVLTVRKNENGGLTAEIVSPMTHGAYLFRAVIRYDCEQDAFVYIDGAFYDILITDQEEEAELGEPTVSGTKGSFSMSQDDSGRIVLIWYNELAPDETIRYVPETK